jgi:SAM-dependent methyltransferase
MQLLGPIRNILRGGRVEPSVRMRLPIRVSSRAAAEAQADETVATRSSRGLEEFFKYIRDQSGLTILDLGGATQQNISFITNLGHRLYSQDFLRTLHEIFDGEGSQDQSNPGQIEYFLRQTLDYPDAHFDAVLIWDSLEYLSPPLLAAVIERLHRIVKPKSYMLSFFHADDRLETVPYYTFRIQDTTQLHVTQRGLRRPAQLFNNRSLEKLFAGYESVKFFLTRERLREVIVKV